jgi:hypothetical protein
MVARPPAFDERGVISVSVQLSLYASAQESAWREFASLRGCKIEEEQDGDWSAQFVALPTPREPSTFFLTGLMHPTTEDRNKAHWSFSVRRVPEEAPKDDVAETSARMGGYPAAMEALFGSGWPGSRAVAVTGSASYILDPQLWDAPLVPLADFPAARRVKGTKRTSTLLTDRLEVAGRVRPASGCVAELAHTTFKDQKTVGLFLTASGRVRCNVTPGIVEFLEGKIWAGLKPLLRLRRATRRGSKG